MEAKAQVFQAAPLFLPTSLAGRGTYGSQEAELAVDKAPTREAALESAILAAELYMAATKHASSNLERARLRTKCQELTSRAESIKKSASSSSSPSWAPIQSKEVALKAPVSQRALSKREEIILLEGSKLHGFIFPQWTSDPDDTLFALDENDRLAYTCVLSSRSPPVPLLITSVNLLI
jgi:calpain-7